MGRPPIEKELCAYLVDAVKTVWLKADPSPGSGQALLKERGHAVLSGRHHPLHSEEQRVPERQGPRPASGEGMLELTEGTAIT